MLIILVKQLRYNILDYNKINKFQLIINYYKLNIYLYIIFKLIYIFKNKYLINNTKL